MHWNRQSSVFRKNIKSKWTLCNMKTIRTKRTWSLRWVQVIRPMCSTPWGGGWLKQFADAGQVLDLAEKIDPSQYVGAALSATTFDDRIYGVPMTLGIAPVFYNKKKFLNSTTSHRQRRTASFWRLSIHSMKTVSFRLHWPTRQNGPERCT